MIRFGVNYTPRRGWFHSWLDFDPAAARDDLAAIAALGLDHVRVFHLWPLLQPNRTMISERAVTDLVRLVDIAGECGLDVAVDAIQGHLSSFDFYPSWTVTWHHRNLFTDPEVRGAQEVLIGRLGAELADRSNVLGLQLGNEMNNLAERNPATAEQVDGWTDALLAAARAALPGRLATHSVYDAAWYCNDHPFTPRSAANKGDVAVVHPWVFTNNCALRYGALSVSATHLAEYGAELARGYADDPHRTVWVQEVGAPEPHVPAAVAAEFTDRTLRNAASVANLYGITWWCSHDVDRSLADYPDLEYSLGLIGSDGTVKPVGRQLADTIADLRRTPRTPAPRTVGLVLDCDLAHRSTSGPGGAYFETWMGLRATGQHPAVVRADRTTDAEYLAARGIRTLRWP